MSSTDEMKLFADGLAREMDRYANMDF